MRSPVARSCVAALVAALLLVAVGCIPIPPDTFRPEQFPPGQGPNIVRAEVFQGLGAWWDERDWSPTAAGRDVRFGLADVDRLAMIGVQTLYVETATWDDPADLLDEALLRQILDRAHSFGIRLVGWYEPDLVDEALDLRRMNIAIDFGFDGFVVDIGSLANRDVDARNAALRREMEALRTAHPNAPIAAEIPSPLAIERYAPDNWPRFPFLALAPYFDAWMPRNNWTRHREDFDAYAYNVENINMLRNRTGVPWLPVHPIGGWSSEVNNDDMAHMFRAIHDTFSIGGSLDDDYQTSPELWARLRWLRIPK